MMKLDNLFQLNDFKYDIKFSYLFDGPILCIILTNQQVLTLSSHDNQWKSKVIQIDHICKKSCPLIPLCNLYQNYLYINFL